jgi:phage tail sheath protein FI
VTDAKYGHAAEAAAGVDGRCTYFTGISGGGFDAPTRLALNGSPGTAGAITAKSEPNVSPIEVYGWRTASANAQWYDLAPRRYMMSLAHRVRLKTLAFTFKPITKVTIADLGNSAKGELVKDLAAGALDPDNPAGPYSIDTTGNTPTTKQQRRLMLRVGAAPIRTGEHVHTDLVFNV